MARDFFLTYSYLVRPANVAKRYQHKMPKFPKAVSAGLCLPQFDLFLNCYDSNPSDASTACEDALASLEYCIESVCIDGRTAAP